MIMPHRLNLDMLILASKSKARQEMLAKTGIAAQGVEARIDERALENQWAALSAAEVAQKLGEAKAKDVSSRHSGFVIGADQTLECEGERFTKAKTPAEMRVNLLKLRGKTHHLHASVAVAQAGKVIFTYTSSAAMTMRAFSSEFLENYLATHFEIAKGSVGCYHYEGYGLQFFEKVEGDYYTILGMPLLPLMDFLRLAKALPA
jgi:septum formation protein